MRSLCHGGARRSNAPGRRHGYQAAGLVAQANGGGSEMSAHNCEDRSITAEGMRRDFGALHAVDGVDLEIPGGRVCGFLGPNDAGKSTLVKIRTTILNLSLIHIS